VLGVSIALELFSLNAAVGEFRHVKAGRSLRRTIDEARDAVVIVVLFEDVAALVGLFAALAGLSLTQLTENAVWDGIGSIIVGITLFGVAYFLARKTKELLIGQSVTQAQRSRIIVMALVAAVLAAALVAVLLSFDSIAQLMKQRASFDQSYDTGRFGRFGRHILGAEMALGLPLGIGPLQFNRFFPEDTHNSYLNAFMSGGWLSGVCYPALVFVTVRTGFRYVFVRVPWQPTYLAIFAAFLGTVGESFIIDTDHWRHFWMMLGVMWGMFVAAERWKAESEAALIRRS